VLSDKERLALEDKEVQLFNGRVLFVGVMVFLMVLLLVDRLYSLQVTQHATFATLSEDNQLTMVRTAPARGLIYDRNGILLAHNPPSFNLEIIPEKNPNPTNSTNSANSNSKTANGFISRAIISKDALAEHIQNVLNDGELSEASVCRKFRQTALDGKD